MKRFLPFIVLGAMSISSIAQNVSIPDANFKAYLVGNTAINTNSDTEIQLSEATVFSGEIDVTNMGISDLTGIESFTAITRLNCRQNSLTSLDVSNNTALTHFDCIINPLGSIDVSSNTNLTSLYCSAAQISTLDISNNTLLDTLYCDGNLLTSLDVSQNPDLVVLQLFNCSGITEINLETNTKIQVLGISGTSISSIDLSNQPDLAELIAFNTDLTALDISANSQITYLRVDNSNLSILNVANGNNTSFTNFEADGNSNLNCIQVDDSTYSANNWTIIDAQSYYSTNCPCLVDIPDPNFKAYLVGLSALNTNSDSEIQCDEASNYIGTIDCGGMNIVDLTGIEAFTSIRELYCDNNQLISIDVSNNTLLEDLRCDNNLLTSLDISSNALLELLLCEANTISSLDISSNTALRILRCHVNDLTSLDVSTNTLLTDIRCEYNQITSLDISNNPNLELVWCQNNVITSLDISNNSLLEQLRCNNNQIAEIDASQNTVLVRLECNDNNLMSLNVANGNNINMSNTNFVAINNSNLTCIQVDDSTYSANNWTNIDGTASFNTSCLCTILNIPDANLKSILISDDNIDTDMNDEISCSEAEAFTGTIPGINAGVSDITGLEAFTNITGIDFRGASNTFTSLDLSNHPNLTSLMLSSVPVSTLALDQCPNLTLVFLGGTNLTEVDFSNNLLLQRVNIDNTDIDSVDLSTQTNLTRLYAANMPELVYLNVKNGNNLNVTEMELETNPKLTCVTVDDAAHSNTNWTNIDPGLTFSVDCESINSIDENLYYNVQLYPNPSHEVIVIEVAKDVDFKIINILGEVQYSGSLKNGINNIGLKLFNTGSYILILDGSVSHRFVVE